EAHEVARVAAPEGLGGDPPDLGGLAEDRQRDQGARGGPGVDLAEHAGGDELPARVARAEDGPGPRGRPGGGPPPPPPLPPARPGGRAPSPGGASGGGGPAAAAPPPT